MRAVLGRYAQWVNRSEPVNGLSGSKTQVARQKPEIHLHPGGGSPPSTHAPDGLSGVAHKLAVVLVEPAVGPELAHQQSYAPSSLPYFLTTDNGRRGSAPVLEVAPVQIEPS